MQVEIWESWCWSSEVLISSFILCRRCQCALQVLTWHTHIHPPTLNFALLQKCFRHWGFSLCVLKITVLVLFVIDQDPGKYKEKNNSARRTCRNASSLKVSLHVQHRDPCIVHSSLKGHQSENRVSYFYWPFSCSVWPAHTACVWVASKSCWTAALPLLPQSTKLIISLSSNSWFQELVTQMPFLLAKVTHIHNWKAETVRILSCVSATAVWFINNNNRDWAGGWKVSLLELALIRIKMKCCGVVWCYNWLVQLHFVYLMVMEFIFTGTLWES